MKYLLTSLLLICMAYVAQAQYQFGSKEEKKLYLKLEEYYENYQYEEILGEEDRILEFFIPKQDTLSALMYSFLGEAYYYLGNTPKAYEYGKKELEILKVKKSDNPEEIKNIVFMLAEYGDELGYFDESEKYYLEVLESDRKMYGVKNKIYLETLGRLVTHYGYPNSLEDAKKGIKMIRFADQFIDDSNPMYPALMSQLGYLYFQTGAYRQAEKSFAEATKAFEKLGMYASEPNVANLNNISTYYQTVGKSPQAEKVSTEALNILNRLTAGNENLINVIQHNIAKTYISLGNYSAAHRYLNQSITLIQSLYGPDTYPEVITLTTIGTNFWYQEKYDSAEATFNKALQILKDLGAEESFDYANVINNLSNIYKAQGDLDKALEYAQRSADSFKKIVGTKDLVYIKALYNLGEIHMLKGDDSTGEGFLKEAQKTGKSILGSYHPERARVGLKLAINQWSQGKMKEAGELYADVFSNYFEQIDNYFPALSEEEKTKFYNNKLKPAFEQFNSFLVASGRENENMIGLMYDFQLATKGILLYATSRVRESIVNSGDSTLINRYFTWIDQMEELSKLYSSTGEGVEERNKKIDSLYQLANANERELSLASAAFAGTYSQSRKTWKDVQNALKPNEAAVEMLRFRSFSPKMGGQYTDEIFYGALVLKKETTTYPELVLIRNGHQLEHRAISTYRNAIKFKMDEEYSYKFFWKPIANNLAGVNKIYFSPDGVYSQVSLYTLLNPDTKKFLIDEIDLHILTNTKDLTIAKNKPSEKVEKSLLFGFPNYNLGVIENDPNRQKLASDIATAASLGRGESRGGTRGASNDEVDPTAVAFIGNTNAEAGLSRGLRGNLQRYMSGNNLMALLPGTKVEVESIASIFKDLQRESGLFTGNEATEREIKEISNPLTLHIATHGFFLENDKLTQHGGEKDTYVENPLLRSGLIMAGANSFIAAGQISEEHEDGEDGILTAYEAMNLNLANTDLVVLSACETGLGEISNGEGVYGLQRAFQVAGAKNIIMSMWTVDDAATQELMTAFYSEWVKTGDRQKAFVTAQRQIKEKYKYPYFWGAFVMIGE